MLNNIHIGTNLIVGNVTVGENSTLEIGGNLVVQGVCDILQYSQLRVWDQSLASFISLNSGQLSQVALFLFCFFLSDGSR